MLKSKMLNDSIDFFLKEDDLQKNFNYINSLPKDKVHCSLKFKDDLMISGLPFFFETLNFLSKDKINYDEFLCHEGRTVTKEEGFEIHFDLNFDVALCAERLALNLLQKSSSISTHAKKFSDKAGRITILDTRKTTPGLRFLEKYATQVGGAKNHRFNQTDIWMIKDNHKAFFGGLEEALNFFKGVNSFYTPIVVEIHSLQELREAMDLGVKHIMLDNFSPVMLKEAIALKGDHATYEVSGGITLDNMQDYLLEGIDAISSGSLTYNAKIVDISLKYKKVTDV